MSKMSNLSSTLILIGGILLLSLNLIQGEPTSEVKKVKVSVYYETLCPDSKRFISSQLNPLLGDGGNCCLDIEFIPYGKANTTVEGTSIFFKCQHGLPECKGNKMHACVIHYLTKPEINNFIGCSMKKSNPPGTLFQCAKELGLNQTAVESIAECSNNNFGDQLLSAYGKKTDNLQPKLYFVPTITFDGVFDETKSWRSQNDFRGVVCEILKSVPHFCDNSEKAEI